METTLRDISSAVGVTDDQQKRTLLLYQAGAETQEIFEVIPEIPEMLTSDMVMADFDGRSKRSLLQIPHHGDCQPYCHKRHQVQMTKG